MRNDFYVTLLQGEFDRGKKKTPKNVEVILSVHDDEGNPMEVNVMLTAHLFAGRFTAPGRFLHVLFKINFARFRVIEFDSFKKR